MAIAANMIIQISILNLYPLGVPMQPLPTPNRHNLSNQLKGISCGEVTVAPRIIFIYITFVPYTLFALLVFPITVIKK